MNRARCPSGKMVVLVYLRDGQKQQDGPFRKGSPELQQAITDLGSSPFRIKRAPKVLPQTSNRMVDLFHWEGSRRVKEGPFLKKSPKFEEAVSRLRNAGYSFWTRRTPVGSVPNRHHDDLPPITKRRSIRFKPVFAH